nr:MAG TPA: hypothetical protein [Caudoviricetes sp.]
MKGIVLADSDWSNGHRRQIIPTGQRRTDIQLRIRTGSYTGLMH